MRGLETRQGARRPPACAMLFAKVYGVFLHSPSVYCMPNLHRRVRLFWRTPIPRRRMQRGPLAASSRSLHEARGCRPRHGTRWTSLAVAYVAAARSVRPLVQVRQLAQAAPSAASYSRSVPWSRRCSSSGMKRITVVPVVSTGLADATGAPLAGTPRAVRPAASAYRPGGRSAVKPLGQRVDAR